MDTSITQTTRKLAQNKTIRLCVLEPGEQFIIPILIDTYRNLTVLRTGDCSICVTGQRKESVSSGWQQFSDRFSVNTAVVPTGIKVALDSNTDGTMSISSSSKSSDIPSSLNLSAKKLEDAVLNKDSSINININLSAPKSRAKTEVQFPQDKNFTIAEICAETGLDYATVNNSFNRQRHNYEVKEKRSPIGRGQPTKVWGLRNK